MPEATKRFHVYHAEATVLEGHLRLPLQQQIKSQAYAKLPEAGGYLAQHEGHYRLESVISFRSAYSQVAGNPGLKPGHGWTTLTTAVVEGLNVLDVVTADRIVAQISVDHPMEGYVPTVTFLGSRFENLKISGHEVKLDLNLNLFGSKPKDDAPYSKSREFLDAVEGQHARVSGHPNLLSDLLRRYTGFSRSAENPEAVECTLVNQASGAFPGQCYGHVIEVPDFGTICLANVRLHQSDYNPTTGTPKNTQVDLTMMDIKMGCLADGSTQVGMGKTNGTTRP